MEPNSIASPPAIDRLATSEEIRAAVLPSPESPFVELFLADSIDGDGPETVCEVAADFGGYVRISGLEFEAYLLSEEMMEQYNTLAN